MTSHASSCWKASDLRGAYPLEISPELFQRIGGALGTKLSESSRVLLAGDFRLSTPALKEALIAGLLATGAQVLDAGQIPTPIAYFAASRLRPDAVLIVTASHNPVGDNGLKLLLDDKPPSPQELIELRELAERGEFRHGHGLVQTINIVPEYVTFMVARWDHLDPACLPTVIVDAGNGAWSEIAPRIFSALHFDVRCLSCQVDGSFPDRSPDCSRPSNLLALRSLVGREGNAVGIAWDGDGDRVAVIDESGVPVSADELSMLMARALLDAGRSGEKRTASVVIDRKLASVVRLEVERLGGKAELERTGHSFMRTRMMTTAARLGLDACGHFFFGELEGADDGVFAALTLLDLLQTTRRRLDDLVKALPAMHTSPELRIPLVVLSFEEAETRLCGGLETAHLERADGIRFTLPAGVVLLRTSGTEPVLSLRVEGSTAEAYRAALARCVELLPEAEASMESQLREHRSRDT